MFVVFSGTKVAKSASTDSTGVTPVTSCVQVSKSLGEIGKLKKTEESEQAKEKNIPESSSKNIIKDMEIREVSNLDGREGPQASGIVQEDLMSGSQSSSVYSMASPSESSQGFESRREEAMEVTVGVEQDESLSRADGDTSAPPDNSPNTVSSESCPENQPSVDHQSKRFKTETTLVISGSSNDGQHEQSKTPDDDQTSTSGTRSDFTSEGSSLGEVSSAKKQMLQRADSADQSKVLGSARPESASVSTGGSHVMEPSNLSASESENKLDGDKQRSASYAGIVKETTKIQNQTNNGEQQRSTLKDSAQHSDRSKNSGSQQSGSDAASTVSATDGKAVSY